MSLPVRLSVNLNKVALLRNSRGGNVPDLLRVARDCESFGADGITLHPRPDQRHARYADIPALQAVLKTELNIEGNPTPEFLHHVLAYRPHQCTLVPDPPGALTSNAGWNTLREADFLRGVVRLLKSAGIRVSLFINADPAMVEGALAVDADRVELFTGPYAHGFPADAGAAIGPFIAAAERAAAVGIGLNAGHDLNLENLKFFQQRIPNLMEVSIGHALISDALYFGLANAIGMYKRLLQR